MNRARSGTTVTKSMQPWTQVLFQFGTLVGLPANNQYGFDILAYQGNGYISVLNEPKYCAQVIGWLLNQQGKLHITRAAGNVASTLTANNNTASAVRRTAVRRRTTATTPAGVTSSTARRGGRTSISRTQTPALAASSNSSSSV